MNVILFFIIFQGVVYGLENGANDCAKQAYELECYLEQGKEYCKPTLKKHCIGYEPQKNTYTKDID